MSADEKAAFQAWFEANKHGVYSLWQVWQAGRAYAEKAKPIPARTCKGCGRSVVPSLIYCVPCATERLSDD